MRLFWEWACEGLVWESPGGTKEGRRFESGFWSRSSRLAVPAVEIPVARSHLSTAVEGVCGLVLLHRVQGEVIGEPIRQLLPGLWGGGLQRESPVPGHEASGACLGIAPRGAARHKLCFTDQAAREVCKLL